MIKYQFHKFLILLLGILFTVNLNAQDTTRFKEDSWPCMDIGKKVNGKYEGLVYTYQKYIFDTLYHLIRKTDYKNSNEKIVTEYWNENQYGKENVSGIIIYKPGKIIKTEYYEGKSEDSIIRNFDTIPFYNEFVALYHQGILKDTVHYENGGKNYVKYSYYDNGKLKSLESIIDERNNGPQIEWYENGKFSSFKNYIMDVEVGTWYEWYENGILASSKEFGYLQSDKNLNLQYYRRQKDPDEPPFEDGDPDGETRYKLQNGNYKFWFANGNLATEGKYINGQKIGEWIQYYENGNLKSKGSYTNNSKRRPVIYKFKNPIQKDFPLLDKEDIYYQYVVQFKDGLWEYYHENGIIEKIQVYKKGVKNGICKYYDEQGKLLSEKTYNNGNVIKEVKSK